MKILRNGNELRERGLAPSHLPKTDNGLPNIELFRKTDLPNIPFLPQRTQPISENVFHI